MIWPSRDGHRERWLDSWNGHQERKVGQMLRIERMLRIVTVCELVTVLDVET